MISVHTLANHILLAAIASSDSPRLFFHFERIESLDQERGSFQCKTDSCNFHPESIFHENNHRRSVMSFYCSSRNQSERQIADQKGQKDQRRRMKTPRQWEKWLHRQVLSWSWEEGGGVSGLWAGDDDPYREEEKGQPVFLFMKFYCYCDCICAIEEKEGIDMVAVVEYMVMQSTSLSW